MVVVDDELLEVVVGSVDVVVLDDDDVVSAGRVVISIYNFVHISGGFAFEKGGQETVNINTGLVLVGPDAAACGLLAALGLGASSRRLFGW